MSDNRKMKKQKKIYSASIISLVLTVFVLVSVTLSWFFTQRELDTLTWIKTPIILSIGSGQNHDIAYLDMGDIDASTASCSADYVFSVYGEPIDIYSLQLAYTTNIAFSYDIYRANVAGSGDSNVVTFTYLENGIQHSENFVRASETPVISGKPIGKMTESEIKQHQSHSLSYGDEYGQNPADTSKVQSNAEPLYWLAKENNVNVMNPQNIIYGGDNGSDYFCDYYIIHISWDAGTVVNDKETDIVYLTASR